MGAAAIPAPVPCILLTGALGSGKTTILQELMRRPDMAGTALVVNEYGEVGLDHLLVSSAVETTLLMENGCMCCSLRGDVVDTILGLFRDVERGELPPFRRILIETTGLADPVPIIRDVSQDAALAGKVRMGAVCTVIDGVLGPGPDVAGVNQIAQADLCILSKDDIADELELDRVRERVAALNPLAPIRLKSRDGLPSTIALETAHDRAPDAADAPRAPSAHAHAAPAHGGVATWSIETDSALDWPAVRGWLDLIYSLHAARLLRMKGILADPGGGRPLLVQGVGPVVGAPTRIDLPEGSGTGISRLVLIFRDLDAAELGRSFAAATGIGSATLRRGAHPHGHAIDARP